MRITQSGLIAMRSLVSKHSHSDEYEFHYIIEGAGDFQTPAWQGRYEPGMLFYSHPKEWHSFQCEKDKTSFYFVRFIPDPKEVDVLSKIEGCFPKGAPYLAGPRARPFLDSIQRQSRTSQELLRRSAEFQLLAFLYELASASCEASPRPHPVVDSAVQWMQNSLHSQFRMEDLARKFNMSKAHFTRVFHQHTGDSPGRHFRQLKLETAAYLLQTTNLSIKEIASRLSFYDEFHFSHAFKQYYKNSPRFYRKKNQNQEFRL